MSVEELLAFERRWLNRPQHDGAKAAAIRAAFGLGVTLYYQRLASVIRSGEAWQVDPVAAGVVSRRMLAAQRSKTA
jgi:hypothetical protein